MADSVYSFVVNSMVCNYHQYKESWSDLLVGEELLCEWEVGNPHDPLAVAVKKTIIGERKIVGHISRRILPLCSVFVRRGGNIKCAVSGPRRYSSDLSQGVLELPCKYLLVQAILRNLVDLENLQLILFLKHAMEKIQ